MIVNGEWCPMCGEYQMPPLRGLSNARACQSCGFVQEYNRKEINAMNAQEPTLQEWEVISKGYIAKLRTPRDVRSTQCFSQTLKPLEDWARLIMKDEAESVDIYEVEERLIKRIIL